MESACRRCSGSGNVLDLVGEWGRAATVLGEARDLAETHGDVRQTAWADVGLAELARKQGRFDAASTSLDASRAGFEASGAEDGLGQVLHLAGTVAAQRGDFPTARTRYRESLRIREHLGDRVKMGALYSNLAKVAEAEGDAPEMWRLAERALAIRLETNDRWGIGVSRNNLGAMATEEGRLDEARDQLEAALAIMHEVGDAWFATTIEVLLANVQRRQGDLDGARERYGRSISILLALDDRLAVAEAFEDVADLCIVAEDHEAAVMLVEAAAGLREEIGSPMAPGMESDLCERLGPSISAIGEARAGEAAARGRVLGAPGGAELVAQVCKTTAA